MATVIDLSNLGNRGFVLPGYSPSDQAGYSVASAGDINGDGFDDLLVGLPFDGEKRNINGAVFVYYGRADAGQTPLDRFGLYTVRAAYLGDYGGYALGASVSSAGDINGDGLDDMILGAPGYYDEGLVYVVYGKAEGQFSGSLEYLRPEDGFTIGGGWDRVGASVSAAGDVNGDGIADVIVGVPGEFGDDKYEDGVGRGYVIFGKAGGYTDINLYGLPEAKGFTIVGDAEYDSAASAVAGAGDINGDGFDDVIIGAASNDDGGTSAGDAYVIFGKAGGFGTKGVVNVASLNGADGFAIQGDAAYDRAGTSVDALGDINGDGFDDIIVGAPGGSDGGDHAGEAYVLYGKRTGFGARVDLTSLSPAAGFVIQGDQAGDYAGWSVACAGDLNGDGFADIVVGAKLGNNGGFDAGEAYVIFGSAGGFGRIDLTNTTSWAGYIIQGDVEGDQAGFSVASAGDVNGDGFDDLIVGAPRNDVAGDNSGSSYVIFGEKPTANVYRNGTEIGQTIHGGFGDDTLNGKGGDDVLLGAEGDDDLKGQGGNDDLNGEDGNDKLLGGAGDDIMHGGDGNDRLSGSRGADSFYGGAGTDTLSGGTGADVFHFSKGGTTADAKTADRIVDFHQVEHDILDLSDYDAIPATKKVTDPFSFIGSSAFSGAAGQLRYEFSGSDTLVSGDLNGDRIADFYIRLTGKIALTTSDFLFASPAAPVASGHAFAATLDFYASPHLYLA